MPRKTRKHGVAVETDCHICGFPASEQDHFPVPRRYGGTATMPICRGCHDAKDRLSTRDVDPGVIFLAIRGLWEKADRAERIMICSILDAMQDAAYVVARKGRRPTVKELEALDSLRDEDIDYSDIPRMDT